MVRDGRSYQDLAYKLIFLLVSFDYTILWLYDGATEILTFYYLSTIKSSVEL